MHSIEDWVYANFDNVKRHSNELNVCCPFCAYDVKFHMYISTIKSVAYCHKCGWSGSYIKLIQQFIGTESYVEAYRQLTAPTAGINQLDTVVAQLRAQQEKTETEETQQQQHTLPNIGMPAWYRTFDLQGYMPYHAFIVLRYALKRLSFNEIERYGIGYCVDIDSPYSLRMIIPVEDLYYQARSINGAAPQKYLNPNISIDGRLFNYEALERFEHVAVTEGAISAIATGEHAVATLGANGATTSQRIRLARSKVKKFTIVVEPEAVAYKKAIDMAEFLKIGHGKQVIMRCYAEGDPASSDVYTEEPYGRAFQIKKI